MAGTHHQNFSIENNFYLIPRYFASYKISMGHDEIMMTPEDFLRSITPGMKQPENLGLDRYITINLDETNKVLLDQGLDESSIFYQLGMKNFVKKYTVVGLK